MGNGAGVGDLVEDTWVIPDKWTIVPVVPFGKRPAVLRWGDGFSKPGGKILPTGDQGIGLLTGKISDVFVVDIDMKNGLNGVADLEELENARGSGRKLPETLKVKTPSGGFHLYFNYPATGVSNNKIAKGIDIRGDQGFIVMPPTKGKDGKPYEFIDYRTPVADAPDWLVELVRPKERVEGSKRASEAMPVTGPPETSMAGYDAVDRITSRLAAAEVGSRNDQLFRRSCQIGNMILAGQVSFKTAEGALTGVIERGGWEDKRKCLDTIRRGLETGMTPKEKTCIVIGHDHTECNDKAIQALANRQDVYVLGGQLAIDNGNGIKVMDRDNLQEILSNSVIWHNQTTDGIKTAHPPKWAVGEIFSKGAWKGIREIKGYSKIPIYTGGGVYEDGYEPSKGILYNGKSKYHKMSVSEARALIDDVYSEFPFQLESHRAAAMCALFTPVAMHAFNGSMPLFLFEASSAGSGKTLIASITSIVGSAMLPKSITFQKDEELRKQVTSIAKEMCPIVLLDNVGKDKVIGGDVLCSILTNPDRVWRDRLLGGNQMLNVTFNTVLYATGNQAQLGTDMQRRCCPIRLTPKEERPEMRSGFRHPNLLKFVEENQERLTSAVLSILQGYDEAGRPEQPAVGGWGSYEEWSQTVMWPVQWAGWGNPNEAVDQIRASGGSGEDRREGREAAEGLCRLLCAKGKMVEGMTASEISEAVYPAGAFAQPVTGGEGLRILFSDIFPKGKPSTRHIGKLLSSHKDIVFGDKIIEISKIEHKVARWRVR